MNTQSDQNGSPMTQGAIECFLLANPWEDSENYSVPMLLRRVADYLDELGDDVIVDDLMLYWDRYADWRTKEFDDELTPRIKVYYHRETQDNE